MAAGGQGSVCISAAATGDLSSSQFYIMKWAAQDVVGLCTSSTMNAAAAIGVLQNDPTTGQAAEVLVFGPTKVVAGEAITVGSLLTCSTAGTANIANTTGEYCWGRALSASTASAQVIEAFCFSFGGGFVFSANSTA